MFINKPNYPNSLLLLGNFELSLQYQQIEHKLNYEKVRLLLVMLAMAKDHKLDRSTLANTIWEEATPDVRRARLRHAIHILKQTLNKKHTIINTHKDHLHLDIKNIFIDALFVLNKGHEKDSIINKIILYQGAFLNNFKFQADSKLYLWQQKLHHDIETQLQNARHRYINEALHHASTVEAQEVLSHCKKFWPTDNYVLQAWTQFQALTPYAAAPTSMTALHKHAIYPPHDKAKLTQNTSYFGIMAIKLRPKNTQATQQMLALLRQQLDQARQLLSRSTTLITLLSESHLLAYYTYQVDPYQLAQAMIHAAQLILKHINSPALNLSIGIHLSIQTASPDISLDPYSYHTEKALMLSWQAQARQIAMSHEVATHLPKNLTQYVASAVAFYELGMLEDNT